MTRSAFDVSLYFLGLIGIVAACLAYRDAAMSHRHTRPIYREWIELLGALVIAMVAAACLKWHPVGLLMVAGMFVLLAVLVRYTSRRLSMPGVLLVTAEFLSLCFGALWSILFLIEAALPLPIKYVALAGLICGTLFFLLGFAERIARNAMLTHASWQQPMDAPKAPLVSSAYRVSIHLPCYAEPPEVVMETMNHLARLEYENFEVLVCDNNTEDEALWRPLEAHCRDLNKVAGQERFRFYHVAPLAGAKAGALNFCLEKMDRNTAIVAVVDADYFAEPDFLSRLVPLFEDRSIGYVQTPHDYREFSVSPYLRSCYWEYMPNNKVDMPGVSEYGGAFTIGTMCLLRATALRKAGGWAEWCLTEDSEVSVRLRAVGYNGIYIGETFGRGLIPETFEDYKKQRFRWTAGPVQQLRQHWRLFLPSPWASPLPGWTKLLEVLRCVAPLRILFGLIAGIMGLGVVVAALIAGAMQPLDIPVVAWAALLLGATTWFISTSHRYRLTGSHVIADMVRGEIARYALTYTVLKAGVAGLSKRPLAWQRTPKFALRSSGASVLGAAFPETMLGLVFCLFAILALAGAQRIGIEFALLSAGSLGWLSFRFLCAPFMARLAIMHAKARLQPS